MNTSAVLSSSIHVLVSCVGANSEVEEKEEEEEEEATKPLVASSQPLEVVATRDQLEALNCSHLN